MIIRAGKGSGRLKLISLLENLFLLSKVKGIRTCIECPLLAMASGRCRMDHSPWLVPPVSRCPERLNSFVLALVSL